MPTALPIMADSESGVSKTRCSPNFSCRCLVTRKTFIYSDILSKYHNAFVSLQFQAECVIESFDHCHLHSLILTSSVLHSAVNQPAAPSNAVKGRPRCSQRSYQGLL